MIVPLLTAGTVAFWMLAPVMVAAALGVVLARKPIHSALCLAALMICLAVQYASQNAPFLFVVQIIVYTGAILMLFLFVVMLVGVDTADSPVETIRHQRGPAIVFGLGFAVLLVLGVGHALTGPDVGVEQANAANGGNVQGLAYLIFSRYVLAFEAASALLITAALGAMVLAHRERLTPKRTQREYVADRMRAYAEAGVHPGNLPNPGVYARHNGIATPALLPDGTISELSVSKTLRERGQVLDPQAMVAATKSVHAAVVDGRDDPALPAGYRAPRPDDVPRRPAGGALEAGAFDDAKPGPSDAEPAQHEPSVHEADETEATRDRNEEQR